VKKLALAALALSLSACAAERPMTAEEMRADNQCRYEAAKVSGYDWIDAALRRAEVRERCMRAKGY
jgi:hypothetical protein